MTNSRLYETLFLKHQYDLLVGHPMSRNGNKDRSFVTILYAVFFAIRVDTGAVYLGLYMSQPHTI